MLCIMMSAPSLRTASLPAVTAPVRRPPPGWLTVCILLLCWAVPALGDTHRRLVAPQGVAVGGFDPVAYFAEGRAQPGAPDIALRWRGVRWHFATPAHRAAFEANPKAYLPQFGGFCALSVAQGRPVPADPEHWAVIDGRLYMAEGAAELARFMTDPQGMLRAARSNWPPRRAEAASAEDERD